MRTHVVSAGLDLSLTGTGVVVLEDGKIIEQALIKSKPVGDKPIAELRRIQKIVGEIGVLIEKHRPYIVVIENLAFGVRNATALTQLSALNYMVRAMLAYKDIQFVLCAPTSLKKFVTGSGGAKKDVMMMETYKRWHVTILNDNECDAYGLAQIGLAILDGNSKTTTKTQKEVTDLIRKQM